MYKLNSLTTFLFAILIIAFVVFLPIVLIEALWNSTIAKTYADISIDFWQALILWLIVLVTLNILGIFKFEFAIETQESFDKELLKKKIQNLQKKTKEKPEIENKLKKDKEE
ncbi:MAG: hypothetical protein HY094_07820 [Candidatus Melainabacteria bacterium]|nr:hypothetical protein [Candidatus Melainabacteria bacterium]